jgi:putative sporulation protein YyaC
VGSVTVGLGALVPGAGVNKTLPEVGSAHVTGTVNVGGFMEYFVLGNTRLHLVVEMAEVIAAGLAEATGQAMGAGSRPGWQAHVASALASR